MTGVVDRMSWNREQRGINVDDYPSLDTYNRRAYKDDSKKREFPPELVKSRAREINSLHGTIITSVDKRLKWINEEDADKFHKEYTEQLEEKASEGLQEEINGRLA